MTMYRLAIITFIILLIVSCKNQLRIEKFEIYGYSIGDSLTNDFLIKNEYGQHYKSMAFRKDTFIKASTIDNQIINFHIKQPVRNYNKTIKKIKSTLGIPRISYVGDTIFGVKLNHSIEYNLWFDTLKNSTIVTTKSFNDSKFYYIIITNDSIGNLLYNRIIDAYYEIGNPNLIYEYVNEKD